jgi:hypothetical protein
VLVRGKEVLREREFIRNDLLKVSFCKMSHLLPSFSSSHLGIQTLTTGLTPLIIADIFFNKLITKTEKIKDRI